MNKTRLFEYAYEFTIREAVDGPTRDLAFRITKVMSSAPVSWLMSDVFFAHEGHSTFCEAYTENGNPAIAVGTEVTKLIPTIKERPLLAAGATIFLRDIPESWWNSEVVVEKLATLIESCCQQDAVALSREHLAEAMKQVFDQVDLGERLLRRGRTELAVAIPWEEAGDFLLRLSVADASLVSLVYVEPTTPNGPSFSGVILVSAAKRKHFSRFTPH